MSSLFATHSLRFNRRILEKFSTRPINNDLERCVFYLIIFNWKYSKSFISEQDRVDSASEFYTHWLHCECEGILMVTIVYIELISVKISRRR